MEPSRTDALLEGGRKGEPNVCTNASNAIVHGTTHALADGSNARRLPLSTHSSTTAGMQNQLSSGLNSCLVSAFQREKILHHHDFKERFALDHN